MPLDPHEEAVIQRLVAAVDKAYQSTGRLMWRAFLSGLMSGLGATVGVAILLWLAGYVFSKLGGVELFRPFVNDLQNMVVPRELQK